MADLACTYPKGIAPLHAGCARHTVVAATQRSVAFPHRPTRATLRPYWFHFCNNVAALPPEREHAADFAARGEPLAGHPRTTGHSRRRALRAADVYTVLSAAGRRNRGETVRAD